MISIKEFAVAGCSAVAGCFVVAGSSVVAGCRRQRAQAEAGSVLPLVGLALAFLLVAAVVLAGLGDRVVSRARAQSAADAAALAGVVEGRAGAEELARANQARLETFEQSGSIVRVVVEHDGMRAEATANLELQVR